MWTKWKSLDQRVRILILLVVIVLQMLLIRYMNNDLAERKAKLTEYIVAHKCVREGFAGKSATPIYKCDSGLWLEYELPR